MLCRPVQICMAACLYVRFLEVESYTTWPWLASPITQPYEIEPNNLHFTGFINYDIVFSSVLQLQFMAASTAWPRISIQTVFSSKSETIPSRYQLQSSQSNQLIFTSVKLSTYGPHPFAVAGPTNWNNLPECLRDPELSVDNFRRQLKTFPFAQYW